VGQTADLVMTTAAPSADSCPTGTLIALPSGSDGLALVLHPNNSFATALTAEELVALLFAETWSEANVAWPDATLTKLTTDESLYRQLVTQLGVADPNLALSLEETAVQLEPDLSQLIAIVTSNPNSIGLVSAAAIRPFLDDIQLATIDGEVAIVEGEINGRYPLTRPILLYTTAAALQAKPFLNPFLTAYLTHIEQTSRSLGYLPPAADQIQRAQARLDTVPPATTDEEQP
jgi:phosphate transport system substrate-binding protein